MADPLPRELNWRQSLADLLHVLDLDSVLACRERLAEELHAPPAIDGADRDRWLRAALLARLCILEH